MRRFTPSCEVAQVFDAPAHVPSSAYGTRHVEEPRSEITARRNRAIIKQPSNHKVATLVNCIKNVPQAELPLARRRRHERLLQRCCLAIREERHCAAPDRPSAPPARAPGTEPFPRTPAVPRADQTPPANRLRSCPSFRYATPNQTATMTSRQSARAEYPRFAAKSGWSVCGSWRFGLVDLASD